MIRYFFITLTILLYLIPFFQNYRFSQNDSWDEREVVSLYEGALRLHEEPFYFEGFVNQERPGIMNHVSSLCPLDNNKMACTWYGGSREGASNVAIYFAIYDDEMKNWTYPTVLVNRSKASKDLNRYIKKVGNSLIFNDTEGRLWLFYVSITYGGWSGTSINYMISLDGGKTWSKSRKMLLSPFLNLTNNVKNRGIHFDDGSFIIPVYHELINKSSQLVWIRPVGDTARYEIKKMTHERRAIQPSLLHEKGKEIVAFFRNVESKDRKYILTARSHDLGQTWSEIADTPLPNPDSGFDTIKLSNGDYIGVINNSFINRNNLTIVMSSNRGRTWKPLKILDKTPHEEFSYPSINRSSKGSYHITYTYKRKRIKHIIFNEAWIRQLDDSIS